MCKNSNQLIIKSLKTENVSDVVEIHRRAFKGHALTLFGQENLKRYYYWLLHGPHPKSYNIGAFDSEALLGYCFSGKFNDSLHGFLRKHWRQLVLYSVSHPRLWFSTVVIQRMRFFPRIGKRFFLSSSNDTEISEYRYKNGKKSFGLEIIAVDPGNHKKGIGHLLMGAMENKAMLEGCEMMHLTVSTDNHQAIRFYEKHGWYRRLDEHGSWHGKME